MASSKVLTRGADEAAFAYPALQPRAELVEARLEPAAALRLAQGEVVIALALNRHHSVSARGYLADTKRCPHHGGARQRHLAAAAKASPNLAHSLVHKLVISAPQCVILQRKQQLPEPNLRLRPNSAAYREEPQKRYTTM